MDELLEQSDIISLHCPLTPETRHMIDASAIAKTKTGVMIINTSRGGVIAEPFAEMNISGNHLEFWKRLVAVGNDPYRWSSRQVPTLVFEGVQVAGL